MSQRICMLGCDSLNIRNVLQYRGFLSLFYMSVISSIIFSHQSVFAETPMMVARVVSGDTANQKYTDKITLDGEYERLEVPILLGSSVLPAIVVFEWPIHDEYKDETSSWDNIVTDAELKRLEKLKIGPFDIESRKQMAPETKSQTSSSINNVRVIIWPSGHAIWLVDRGEMPGAIRSRKGQLVEYRYGILNYEKLIGQLEKLGKYDKSQKHSRKSVLYDLSEKLYGGTKFYDLTIIGSAHTFKFISQFTEEENDDYYAKHNFSSNQPKKDVKQFIEMWLAIQEALPQKKNSIVLKTEPNFVWKGKVDITDFWKKPSSQEKKNGANR